ncbi:COG2365 Protein tyrosine/serine phosphatase [Rhabdaerophilaceae bacterium]
MSDVFASSASEHRTVQIDGLSNFRDFGGKPLVDGKRIASGRFYRSAAPGRLTPQGIRTLSEHGITTIIDLRGVVERKAAPTPQLDGSGLMVISTPVEPNTSGNARQALAEGTATPAKMRDLMIASYRGYVAVHAEAFGNALAAMILSDTPSMVHCTAGKDRTGFIVAVLQRAFGVPESAVVEDYLRTNTDWDRTSVSAHLPKDAPEIQPMLVADADYLDAAFAEIARIDGSLEAFIMRAASSRITREALARFV